MWITEEPVHQVDDVKTEKDLKSELASQRNIASFCNTCTYTIHVTFSFEWAGYFLHV